MELKDTVGKIKNVGTQRAKLLNNLGIYTVEDIIEYFPRDYEDRRSLREISDLMENTENTFSATVEKAVENVYIGKMYISRTRVYDDSGSVNVIWYNQKYIKNAVKKDCQDMFTGKVQIKNGRREVISPEFEILEKEELLNSGRIIPVYPLTKGLSQKVLRSIIKYTIDNTKNALDDFLPKSIRMKYKLCERNFAVSNIHFPESDDAFFEARKRLVFEELFMLQTALFKIKSYCDKSSSGIKIYKKRYLSDAKKLLGFELTDAQKKVVDEIMSDMSSGKIMNRLVQGDVGSGKTAVALCGAYVAIKNGFQSVLMAPTEVLAKQHYDYFSALFGKAGISVGFLSGSIKKKEKDAIYENIENGNMQMIIGTHAVIQKDVHFKNVGLVITDEQHRFGVNQRKVLSEKGENPHVLVMTATPIPRTLALILYGDLDISIIDTLPPGRQKTETLVVNTSYRKRIYTFIEKEILNGHQAYIVCPVIEENEENDMASVESYGEDIKKEFAKYNVGILHGKMKNDEKEAIMSDFAEGKTNILVSTTVIEVGVNVPNATIMLIENAERFGLSQLHQLRGRVGRSKEQSYCILVSDSKNQITKQRLMTMKRTNDGFEISETDLKLRGPGDFFGTKQHGIPPLKIANLYTDMEMLKLSQEAATELLSEKDALDREENKFLKERLENILLPKTISI